MFIWNAGYTYIRGDCDALLQDLLIEANVGHNLAEEKKYNC